MKKTANYRVLIVEDNKLLAAIITTILTDLQIETKTVLSGEDALDSYNNNYYDMVLIDIMMPNLSGFDVSKEIRSTDMHIPIVALTSIPLGEIKSELEANGINHYLSKPSNADDLKKALLQYFKTAA